MNPFARTGGQAIMIGDDIKVNIDYVTKDNARLTITLPKGVFTPEIDDAQMSANDPYDMEFSSYSNRDTLSITLRAGDKPVGLPNDIMLIIKNIDPHEKTVHIGFDETKNVKIQRLEDYEAQKKSAQAAKRLGFNTAGQPPRAKTNLSAPVQPQDQQRALER